MKNHCTVRSLHEPFASAVEQSHARTLQKLWSVMRMNPSVRDGTES
jgi:hypothetical protein